MPQFQQPPKQLPLPPWHERGDEGDGTRSQAAPAGQEPSATPLRSPVSAPPSRPGSATGAGGPGSLASATLGSGAKRGRRTCPQGRQLKRPPRPLDEETRPTETVSPSRMPHLMGAGATSPTDPAPKGERSRSTFFQTFVLSGEILLLLSCLRVSVRMRAATRLSTFHQTRRRLLPAPTNLRYGPGCACVVARLVSCFFFLFARIRVSLNTFPAGRGRGELILKNH